MAVAVIIAMLGLSAFFSGSEIAFVAADRLRVEMKARQRGFVGRLILEFFERPARLLTTTLVGNNLALVVYSTLMALVLYGPLQALLAPDSGALPETGLLVAQTAVAALLVLLLGEIIPKTFMREWSDRAVFILAIPLSITYVLLLPLVLVTGWTSQLLLKLLGAKRMLLSQFPRRAFERVIEENLERGSLDLDAEESEILSNVFELHSKRVKESMTPRTEMVAVPHSTSLEEFRSLCIDSGYSKVPVYRNNIDAIVGIAFAYDLFDAPSSLTEMMRPAKFVPESKPARDLLQEFRDTKSSVVIVVDEYGGTAGLITREDLLEELFGDIQDEFDSENVTLRRVDANTYVLSGRAELDELGEKFDLEFPPGDYETIAGYILERCGTIPDPHETIECDGNKLTILEATRNRIELVRLETRR